MRWFKHMVASWDDEKIAAFVDGCGLEGYGFWWRVLELIAAQVDACGKNYCSYPKRKWCNMLAINHQTWSKLIARAERAGLFVVSEDEQGIRVESPNILKFRDEYTERKFKKSGQHLDKLRPSRARLTETETEAETDVKEKKEYSASAAPAAVPASCAPPVEEPTPERAASPVLPKATQPVVVPKSAPSGGELAYRTKKGRRLKGGDLRDFEHFWRDFALPKGKAEAADAWLDITGKTPELTARICAAARQEAAARAALEARGQTPKWAQGWLAARRWEDYAPSGAAPVPSSALIAPPPDIPDPTPEDLERTRRNALQWRARLRATAEGGAA